MEDQGTTLQEAAVQLSCVHLTSPTYASHLHPGAYVVLGFDGGLRGMTMTGLQSHLTPI